MIHELREYEIAEPQCLEYLALLKDVGMPIRGDHFGRLVGAWLVKDANPARFIHIWEYGSFDDRTKKRAELAEIDLWRNSFLPKAAALVSSQWVSLLTPVNSTKPSSPLTMSLYQMQCRLGKSASYLTALQSIVDKHYDNFAIWRVEVPDPNGVMLICGTDHPNKTSNARSFSNEILSAQPDLLKNIAIHELSRVTLQ